jgi:hypothetical protein
MEFAESCIVATSANSVRFSSTKPCSTVSTQLSVVLRLLPTGLSQPSCSPLIVEIRGLEHVEVADEVEVWLV